MTDTPTFVRWLETLSQEDVALVGGKNAALGEMTQHLASEGIRIPDGFATTTRAYWAFLEENDLSPEIESLLHEWEEGTRSIEDTGEAIRDRFRQAAFPPPVEEALRTAYRELSARSNGEPVAVAVRSSATAEDQPQASFAGQQESFLNVRGEEALLDACRKCYASLFTDRALSARKEQGMNSMDVALSVGVHKMVRANDAGAGVLFTLDTETGFPDVVLVNAAWGLGVTVMKGQITPDQYVVYKPFLDQPERTPILSRSLGTKKKKCIYLQHGRTESVPTSREERRTFVIDDDEILTLARWGAAIEAHYGRPMDVEWAKDGPDGPLYIVQARPETVQSRRNASALKSYRLAERGTRLVTGTGIGEAIASGPVCLIYDPENQDRFTDGSILVTDSTDPEWTPILKRAAGIVTDYGGRASHAAIVSRELGLPAVVGTGNATDLLRAGQHVTLSCADEEQGVVYDGLLPFEVQDLDLSDVASASTRIMMNVSSPAVAMRWWRLPVDGIGLARMEYLIGTVIKVHPLALTRFDTIEDPDVRTQIETLCWPYEDKREYFVETLAQGLGTIAASQYPDPVLVRTSDFTTNEYAELLGGDQFEPDELNPSLGWRGASRYYSEDYRDGFGLECEAIRRVRDTMGFTNLGVVIPFCRTPEEADRVLETMAEYGLERGRNDLKVNLMVEVPSNVTLLAEFAERFDGFSIGSNDLTQLVLGVDRTSERLAELYDERHDAVKRTIRSVIDQAHAAGRPVSLCGQAPSDYPEFAAFLVDAGIDAISLFPDAVLRTIETVVKAEKGRNEQWSRPPPVASR